MAPVIAEKSNIIKNKTEETRNKIESFKFLILIHQKSHMGRVFDDYIRLNELTGITAKEKAIAELSKIFPRKLLMKWSQQEKTLQTNINPISQHKDANPSTKSMSDES